MEPPALPLEHAGRFGRLDEFVFSCKSSSTEVLSEPGSALHCPLGSWQHWHGHSRWDRGHSSVRGMKDVKI